MKTPVRKRLVLSFAAVALAWPSLTCQGAAPAAATVANASPASVPPYDSLSADDQARLAWWLDARYGMFIHWGVASLIGVDLSWGRGGSKPLDIYKHPARLC